MKRYGDDNWQELIGPPTGYRGRISKYGSSLAAKMGLVPLGDFPDMLVKPADFKEVIADCHERQLFPMYHQADTWAPPGFKYNQNGLPYCWAWGCTSVVMDCRAAEGKPTVQLAAVSLGWLVDWQSRGYYCDATINGAMERGIAPANCVPNMHSRNYQSFADDWKEQAMLYRPFEWWDTKKDSVLSMISQCLTILRTGRSGYVGNDDWSHAYSICGLRWDETVKYNIVWIARNSHDESEPIELTGDFGVPDEFIGVRATVDTGV